VKSDDQPEIKLTPQQKLDVAESLYWSAWHLKAAWLRQIHPELTQTEIEQKVKSIFKYTRS